MFELGVYLWLIMLLPLAGSVLIAAVARRLFPAHSHLVCIAAAIGACAFSILAFIEVSGGDGRPMIIGQNTPWISAGDVVVNFSLRADGLTAVMLVMVTFIGSLIAIYSAGYMHGDP